MFRKKESLKKIVLNFRVREAIVKDWKKIKLT